MADIQLHLTLVVFLNCYKNKSLSFSLCVKNGIGQWHPIKIIFQFESLKIWKQQWKSHKKSDLKWAKLWSTLEKLKPRPEVKKLVENRFGSNFLFLLQTHFSIDDIFSNPSISCSFYLSTMKSKQVNFLLFKIGTNWSPRCVKTNPKTGFAGIFGGVRGKEDWRSFHIIRGVYSLWAQGPKKLIW